MHVVLLEKSKNLHKPLYKQKYVIIFSKLQFQYAGKLRPYPSISGNITKNKLKFYNNISNDLM